MEVNVISEGVTDQEVIEAIVQGYMSNKELIVEPLQPKKGEPGGWPLVIQYCKSDDFKESLPYSDGITIIHLDCDVFKGAGLPADCIMQFNGLSIEETFEMVKSKLIEFIGQDIYNLAGDRIAFAIGIDLIECWFLPLYFANKPATCNKVSGCIDTLNPALMTKHGFYIRAKDPENYTEIAKAFKKKKAIDSCYKRNDSFRLFIDSLDSAIGAYQILNP